MQTVADMKGLKFCRTAYIKSHRTVHTTSMPMLPKVQVSTELFAGRTFGIGIVMQNEVTRNCLVLSVKCDSGLS